MMDICFRTHLFPTAPEGDLEGCNGAPGSPLAGRLRQALSSRGYTCRAPLQEDYGWGFYVDADGCSIWVSAACALPAPGEPAGTPEWHVGAGHDFPPWALGQWFRRSRGRVLAGEIYAILRQWIVSQPGVVVEGEQVA